MGFSPDPHVLVCNEQDACKEQSKLPRSEGKTVPGYTVPPRKGDSITRYRLGGIMQLIESGSICCIGPGTKKIIINKGFASNLFNLKIKSPILSLDIFWAMFLHSALKL
jgi:hypothetical protein